MSFEFEPRYLAVYSSLLVVWLVIAVVSVVSVCRLLVLKLPRSGAASPPMAEDEPFVSIVIPARNEERNIEACLRSLLAIDYPNFEVIVSDDRSSDQTAAIVNRVAKEDGRLQLVQVTELPTGWAGKPHALHSAIGHAKADWLLFVDADATLHPQNLRAAMAYVHAEKVDVYSLLPGMRCETIWERLIQPLASIALSLFFRLPRVNDDRYPDSALASGQYILMTRKAYAKIGGHAAVRDKLMEDIAIAVLTKRHGLRLRLASSPELLSVRMYASPREMLRGWSRIYFGAVGDKTWKLWTLLAAACLCSLSAYVVTAVCAFCAMTGYSIDHFSTLVALNVLHHLLIVAATAPPYRQSGGRVRDLWGYSLAVLMVCAALCRAIWMTYTQKVTWRGMTYQVGFQEQRELQAVTLPVSSNSSSAA